jgi:hypothetical protein
VDYFAIDRPLFEWIKRLAILSLAFEIAALHSFIQMQLEDSVPAVLAFVFVLIEKLKSLYHRRGEESSRFRNTLR